MTIALCFALTLLLVSAVYHVRQWYEQAQLRHEIRNHLVAALIQAHSEALQLAAFDREREKVAALEHELEAAYDDLADCRNRLAMVQAVSSGLAECDTPGTDHDADDNEVPF